ncbi:helix-turn-helix transcriptional regulator [Frankia sp. Cppng1_Ct_nod]|uniref:helix-turn-helix domain-containing protein n=1 Tax=Frankia sp. Cppng1_Ct_nod TaxID=2897162 RepID=UPI0032EA8393
MRLRRREATLSQHEVGRRAHCCPSYISKIERETEFPTVALVHNLDQVLDAGGAIIAARAADTRARPSRSPAMACLTCLCSG